MPASVLTAIFLISTGTPSGIGRSRGIFVKPGDVVRIEIEGIGEMINPVITGQIEHGPTIIYWTVGPADQRLILNHNPLKKLILRKYTPR